MTRSQHFSTLLSSIVNKHRLLQFASFGLVADKTQRRILWSLACDGPLTHSQLTEKMKDSAGSISNAIRELVKHGVLFRKTDETPRGTKPLYFTKGWEQVVISRKDAVLALVESTCQDLEDDEAAELDRLLNKILSRINFLEAEVEKAPIEKLRLNDENPGKEVQLRTDDKAKKHRGPMHDHSENLDSTEGSSEGLIIEELYMKRTSFLTEILELRWVARKK